MTGDIKQFNDYSKQDVGAHGERDKPGYSPDSEYDETKPMSGMNMVHSIKGGKEALAAITDLLKSIAKGGAVGYATGSATIEKVFTVTKNAEVGKPGKDLQKRTTLYEAVPQ